MDRLPPNRCRNPPGHVHRNVGHDPGITGHVGPEYSHARAGIPRAALGGRAQLCLAGTLVAAEPRFRTHARGAGRAALRGLCHAHAAKGRVVFSLRYKFTTPSKILRMKLY